MKSVVLRRVRREWIWLNSDISSLMITGQRHHQVLDTGAILNLNLSFLESLCNPLKISALVT